jgi:hypothetical protein
MLWLSIPNFVIGNTPLPIGLLRQLRLQCRRCHLPKIRISEDSEFIQGCESAGILIGRLSRFMCFFVGQVAKRGNSDPKNQTSCPKTWKVKF